MPVEYLTHGTAVYTGQGHSVGSDALLLARFALPRTGRRCVDLCAGCGTVGLEWLDAGAAFELTAVELDGPGAALVRQSYARYNGPAVCRVVQADARALRLPNAGQYELIACNPPYFTGGPRAASPVRARARHEGTFTLEDLAAFAARHLQDGGRLSVCCPPSELARLCAALAKHALEPKRLQTVRNHGKPAPWLVLLEAQKGRRPGLRWLPEQVLDAGAALYGQKAGGKEIHEEE